MQFSIHAAKTQLSKLIRAALAGEEVIIANGDTPLVKLVPSPRAGYKLGGLEGKIASPSDEFFGPLGGADLSDWE